jgi:hypothetical protein
MNVKLKKFPNSVIMKDNLKYPLMILYIIHLCHYER